MICVRVTSAATIWLNIDRILSVDGLNDGTTTIMLEDTPLPVLDDVNDIVKTIFRARAVRRGETLIEAPSNN